MVRKLLGAASPRQKASPRRRADDLADVALKDHDGNEVRLGDLWGERPVVLAWLRHYG